MTDSVHIVEVGPRDGLQNEKVTVSVETKIRLVERLAATGFRTVEAGAFVSPKWVPQMAASDEVLRRVKRRPGVAYPVLTPNMKGYDAARAAGADMVAVFGAASETFSRKNINCSIAESIDRFRPIMEAAVHDGIPVRGYVSCVLGCPYEGDVDVARVAEVSKILFEAGCAEISLGDTIGVGTPRRTAEMIRAVRDAVPAERLAGHFHDTYGQALANVWTAYEMGVRTFDASVAGLGGCPYAKGASGNVASEDVIYSFERSGVPTGVDLDAVIESAAWISDALGRRPESKVTLARATS